MNHNFPYLKDSAFLKQFDRLKLKEQFVKIIVLDFHQNPIKQIEGICTGGNFNIDGSSAMRRTGTVNLITNQYKNSLMDVSNLLSINKKVQVLIGFTNITNQYTDYQKIWFPMGIYAIISPNISQGTQGISISLTLHDKMAFLNGECGGIFPASVVFDTMQDIDGEGNIIITKPTIYQIIMQLVNHFGNEQLGKIIISDIDNKIRQVMRWTGSSQLQKYSGEDSGSYYLITEYEKQIYNLENQQPIQTYDYGDDVGYILTDFVYPTELIANAGETITTILDRIREVLGNYQYFYDINGNFRFQQIKNYLNTSYSTQIIKNLQTEDYLTDYATGKTVYTFDNADLIISYSNAPQYQQIKNDFMVWGKKISLTGNNIPIRYHLAIDKKPKVGNTYSVFFFDDKEDGIKNKAKVPIMVNQLPSKGQNGLYYCVTTNNNTIYKYEFGEWILTDYQLETIVTNDFRSELYLAGAAAQPKGTYSNYYYTELKNEWPKLYNLKGQNNNPPDFYSEYIAYPYDIDYFLDFIDTQSIISQFSIDNIGRRTTVIVDDSINCIFQPQIPSLIIIQTDQDDTDDLREQAENRGWNYTQVSSNVYNLLLTGGRLKSAFDEIKKELYQYTNYNEQISLTTLPIYYLQPNTRITINSSQTDIHGDFIIKTISLPLDINGTMSLSCTKALQRI